MILKYIDELALRGAPPRGSEREDVVLMEVSQIVDGRVEWAMADQIELPREALFYDDTPDPANQSVQSWQYFYRDEAPLTGKEAPTWGTGNFHQDGGVVLGAALKAGIYLRYSLGFREWLRSFDGEAAAALDRQVQEFQTLLEPRNKKVTKANWWKADRPDEDWALPVIARRSDGRIITIGLDAEAVDSREDLREKIEQEAEDVLDVDSCIELARTVAKPEKPTIEVVDDELQVRSGLGRNAFGNEPSNELNGTEYGRLLGPSLATTPLQSRQWWSYIKKFERRLPIAPAPDNSGLLFFPEGELSYKNLAKALEREQDRMRIYQEAWSQHRNPALVTETVDAQPVVGERPSFIPEVHSVTIIATVLEGAANKQKRMVIGVFPSILLYYWKFLNHELLRGHLGSYIPSFNRAAITGHTEAGRSNPPSVYALWTEVLTQALQRHWVSIRPFWNYLPRFFRAYPTEDLVQGGGPATYYLQILSGLKRLQHLIGIFRQTQVPPEEGLKEQLRQVEAGELLKYGVMSMEEATARLSAKDILGEWYDVLWTHQKRKIDEFVSRSTQAAPPAEYPTFIRGVIVGMLLSELTYVVQTHGGRRFEATQGRHPATMRGDVIEKVVSKGLGLLQNVGKQQTFNTRVLPFIYSCTEESKKTTFNNGLIMGMAYIPSKAGKQEEEVEDA